MDNLINHPFINSTLGVALVMFLFKFFDKRITQLIDWVWSKNKEKSTNKIFIREQIIAMLAEAKKADYTIMPRSSEHWQSIILKTSLTDERLSSLLQDYYNKWTQISALYLLVNEIDGEMRKEIVRMMKNRSKKAKTIEKNIMNYLKSYLK